LVTHNRTNGREDRGENSDALREPPAAAVIAASMLNCVIVRTVYVEFTA
jgi:hypothetical protein